MADIKLTDLVDGALVDAPSGDKEWQGTGVFDKLIEAVNKNLEAQYLNQRIKGSDYAMVYSNSIVAAIGQAIEYLLREEITNKQILDIQAGIALKEAQLDLIEAQIRNTDADTDNKVKQLDVMTAGISNTEADTAVKGKQLDVMDVEIANTEARTENVESNTAVNVKQIEVLTAGIDNTESDTANKVKQLDVQDGQIANLTADVELKQEQERLAFVQRVKLDKETAMLGLDEVIKGSNTDKEPIYTPKYGA